MKPYKPSLVDQFNSSIVAELKMDSPTTAWAEEIIKAIPDGFFTTYFQVRKRALDGGIYCLWCFMVPCCMSFEDYEVIQEAEQFLRNCFSTDDADPWISNIAIEDPPTNHDLYKEFRIDFGVDSFDFED